jgi:hypothetical protein
MRPGEKRQGTASGAMYWASTATCARPVLYVQPAAMTVELCLPSMPNAMHVLFRIQPAAAKGSMVRAIEATVWFPAARYPRFIATSICSVCTAHVDARPTTAGRVAWKGCAMRGGVWTKASQWFVRPVGRPDEKAAAGQYYSSSPLTNNTNTTTTSSSLLPGLRVPAQLSTSCASPSSGDGPHSASCVRAKRTEQDMRETEQGGANTRVKMG